MQKEKEDDIFEDKCLKNIEELETNCIDLFFRTLKLSKKMGGEAPHLFGSFYCPLGFPRPQKLAQQFTARLPSDTQALCDYVVITRTTK